MLVQPDSDDRADVVGFIVDQQRRPERNVAYLGTGLEGVTAELEGLEPAWTTTARIAREDGRIVGVVAVAWDEEVGRSWVMGPWVAHDDDRWLPLAEKLLDAALGQVPPAITRHEMSGDLANHHPSSRGPTRRPTSSSPASRTAAA